MRVLTALLCIACTRAYVVKQDSYPYIPKIPPLIPLDNSHMYNPPALDAHPHLVIRDDSHQLAPNVMTYWGYQKPRDPLPPTLHHHHSLRPYVPNYYDSNNHRDFVFPVYPPYKYPHPTKPAVDDLLPGILDPSNDGNQDSDEDLSNEISPDQPQQYPSNEDLKLISQASSIENNLKAAMKLAANLKEDTHIDDSMTFLDPVPHYNAILGVLIALAEDKCSASAPRTDFDSYYNDHYLNAVEEYYPSGLLNPSLVSQKVQYYIKLFNKKIRSIKRIVEENCSKRLGPCNRILAAMLKTFQGNYREIAILESLADLAVTYDQVSEKLMEASEKYQELPYLLNEKEDLKELVMKFYRLLELTTQQTQPCQEEQDNWVAGKDQVSLKY